MTKSDSEYIEHEVKIRVQEHKFLTIEEKLKSIESRLTWILSLLVGGLLLPLFLKVIS